MLKGYHRNIEDRGTLLGRRRFTLGVPLARTGAEGRARGESAGAHAEARAERRGNVAEEVAAAGTVAFGAERGGTVGAEPVAASIAKRIDALNGEAGHILHFPPQWP